MGTTPPPRVLLLINPHAGRGRGAHRGEAAAAALRRSSARVHVIRALTTTQARLRMIDALREPYDGAVIVGGDGTVAGVVDLLVEARVPLALVPAGTGDDLARDLGIIAWDPPAAALAVLDGSARPIDVGVVETKERVAMFLTVAAMGFDAKVSERTNMLRWPHGRMRYHLALLIELLRLQPTRFRVTHDDGRAASVPGTLLAVGNTASYGGGMPMCVGARPDDGLLDTVHVAPLPRWRLLRLFPLLLRGAHLARPEVDHRLCQRVRVSAPDLVVYADGERIGTGECEIRIMPAALTVMLPEPYPLSGRGSATS